MNYKSIEGKNKSGNNNEFMNEFREDILREKIYMSNDFKMKNKT